MALTDNSLTGSIPAEYGELSELKELVLGTQLSSGDAYAPNPDYATLRLPQGANRLTGGIPETLRRLTKLEVLVLDRNRLTGEIPSWIGELTELRVLVLDWNLLTGEIPVGIGDLGELRKLELNHNQLTGSIPKELGKLSNSARDEPWRECALPGAIPHQNLAMLG